MTYIGYMIDAQKIWSSTNLPTLPSVALRLIELSRTPDSSIGEIAAAIKPDPAIVVRLLKAANSSFFGQSSNITSIEKAVTILGTTAVTALALGFSLVEGSRTQGALGDAYSAFWLQSAVQATAAKMIAGRQAAGTAEDLFLAGLLLDVGRLAMLKTIPEEYQAVVEAAATMQRPLHELETELLGLNHIDVGVELMKRWNFPVALCDAVRCHHENLQAFVPGSAHDPLLAAAVIAAAFGDYFCTAAKGQALERLQRLAEEFLKLSTPGLHVFLGELRQHIDEIAVMFSINAQDLDTPSELLAQANEQLALLTISAQAESTYAQARQVAAEREVRQLEVKHEQLKEQALRDPLTRLYNRHFFDETLTREIQRCARHALPLGVIFFDADRFKSINDSYGHAFGDEVLKRIAAVASETVRAGDVLARYGGEEFVALIAQPTERGLEKTADRIRAGVESTLFMCQNQPVQVTVSVGAALTIPERSGQSDGLKLVKAADELMYSAKQTGRNRVCFRNYMSEFNRQLVADVLQRRFSRWLVRKQALDLTSVSRALLQCPTEHIRLGALACQFALLADEQIAAIRTSQAQTGARFGEAAVKLGFLGVHQLAGLLALQHENPRELAVVLARLGMLEAGRIQSLLDGYEMEMGLETQLALQ